MLDIFESVSPAMYWLACFVLLIASSSCYQFHHALISRRRFSRVGQFSHKTNFDQAQPRKFDGEGCVLIATPDQLDNEKLKTVVLITEKNEDGIVGQIVNNPSSWTMGEMAYESPHFQANTLFRGGKSGKDTAIMIHKYDLGANCKKLGNGIFIGGSAAAKERIESFQAHPREFKFIFNWLQWAPGVLEKEIKDKMWDVYDVPIDVLLQQDEQSNLHMWKDIRTNLNLPLTIQYT